MIRTDSFSFDNFWATNFQQDIENIGTNSTDDLQNRAPQMAAAPESHEANMRLNGYPYSASKEVIWQQPLLQDQVSLTSTNLQIHPAPRQLLAQLPQTKSALDDQVTPSNVNPSGVLVLKNGRMIAVSTTANGNRIVTEQNGGLRIFSAQNSDQDLINSGILNGESSTLNQLFDKQTMLLYGSEMTVARSGKGEVVLVLPSGTQLKFHAQTTRVDLFKSQLVKEAVTADLQSNTLENERGDSTLASLVTALNGTQENAEKGLQAQVSASSIADQPIKIADVARIYALKHLDLKPEQILNIEPVIADLTSETAPQKDVPDFLPQKITFLTKTPNEAEQEKLVRLSSEINVVARQMGIKTFVNLGVLLIGVKAAHLSYTRADLAMHKAALDEGFKRMYGEIAAAATRDAGHTVVAGVVLKLTHSAATDTYRDQFQELTGQFNLVFRQAYGVDNVVVN